MINLKYAHFNVSILYIFGIKIVLGPQYFFYCQEISIGTYYLFK